MRPNVGICLCSRALALFRQKYSPVMQTTSHRTIRPTLRSRPLTLCAGLTTS